MRQERNKQHKEGVSKLGHTFPERNQSKNGSGATTSKKGVSGLGHTFPGRNQSNRISKGGKENTSLGASNTKKP